ncbi:hypothetical protein ACIBSV_17670, partial [Embleya sp. NPDC050154]|uniref:hypothetical protein n=1 Tax=Embleya sp. NPDC050154 TaxID=3363988 RepID=UPI003794F0D3
TLTDLDGRPIPNREVTAIQDGYRVTDPTTNTSIRYNTTDGSIEHGTRLGADDTHFVVDHGNNRPTLTDLDGRPIPNREVTAIQDGYRVTDPTTNTSNRYNTTDGSIEHGTPLRAGADETHFVVDAGNGRLTLTDTHGTLVPGREVTAVQGGYRVTDNVGGASVRYTADGAVAERGIALGGAGDPRFVVAEGTGHRLTDTHGVLRPEVVQTHPGGGYRVEPQPGGARTYERFDAGGNPVGSGQELFDATGTRIGYVDRPTAGPALMLDNAFDPGSARPATSTPDGIRVDDAHGGHRVFDNNSGALTHETIVLRDPSAAAPTARVTVDHATGAAPTVHLVEAPGVPGPARTVTRDPVTGELRVTINEPNSPRHGEFRTHGNDGSLGHEGFNVLRGGRRTDHQYVVDHHARTWRQEYRDGVTPPADVNKPAGFERNGFERGTVDASGAANGGIKLKSATPGKVDVFERRLLPGGNTLDAFRRTDLSGFGSTSRRTTWVEYGVDGAVANSGTRRFDTSGFGWQDVDSGGSVVRESRDTLQKFDGKAGHTLGIEGDTGWTWHRYDATGNELAHGPRTPHADGGWSDRTIARPDAHGNTPARGDLVQKQWGPLHSPNNARHYVEHPLARPTDPAHTTWDVQPSWDKQSPQGKESGKHEVKADGSTFTTNRVSEQRPPQWARRMLGDGGTQPTGIHAFLGPDTRYQMFAWEKTTPNPAGGEPLSHSGARFVGDDGGYVDIHADGTFARSQTKLHSGSTLKVGDTVAPHPNAPAGSVPWNDGGTTGYRIETPGGAPGDAVWQDIRFAADGTDPRVVREGFANGNVREYNAPQPHHDPAGNPVADPNANWVQRDGHGYPTGQRHTWPTADGTGQVTVTAAGKPTARTWDWQAVDSNGNVTEGKRVLFRGSDDPKLPFDDSFRDFDARNNLVRERRMLDGGKYVDAWRTETDGWKWQKFGRNGAETPHPRATGQTGEQVRTWWNPEGGANGRWEPHPTDHKNLLFRDEYRPSTGANVVVRETPPHIGDSAPARVREYHPGGDTTPAPGTWKEFDHGSAVRTREQLPDGTYLETDAWRGQWRHYSAGDHLLGRRTDGGVVITTDSLGRWQAIGTEYDFRGPLSELRGWGRRIREGQRMPWTDGRQGIDATRFRGALQGLPNIPATGAIRLAEAAYQPYWSVIAKKALLEFGQEFVIEFAANLIANGINAAINNKPFTGKDVLKSFANAAVGSAVKTTLGTFIHENRLTHTRWMGDTKSGLGNIDGGKHWSRRPGNHDKTWANEWAGNETPIRWRSGTYDFGFNVGLGGITGWVNGAMNASVWGITGADGLNHKLTGWDAFLDGGLSAFSGMLSNGSVALARNVALSGAGGRLFHRQGFNEFVLNIAFKSLEKVFSGWLTPTLRGAIHPYWY